MEHSRDPMGNTDVLTDLAEFWRDRIAKHLRKYNWAIIAGLWGTAFTLGYIGFAKYFAANGEERSMGDIFYVTLQLFTVESGSVSGEIGWQLEAARLLAPAATLYTAIQAFALIFREQLQHLKMRFYRGHIIICGLGRRGLLLARAALANGRLVVVIDKNAGNERIEQAQEHGAVVVIGNASDPEVLREARVHTAAYVVALCGDDGVNAEVAIDARKLSKRRRGPPLYCVVQIGDSQLLNLLRGQEMGMGRDEWIRLEFFNVFERGARAVLHDHSPFASPLNNPPHILVVGVGRMGESLITHAARQWRNMRGDSDERLKVTMIDRYAEAKRDYLLIHFPVLERICDLHSLEMDVTSPSFYRADFLEGNDDRGPVTAIYVLLDNDSRAMTAALSLQQKTRSTQVPIVVRMSHEDGLAELLQGVDQTRPGFGSVSAFGLFELTCTPDLIFGGTHEMLARAIHEEFLEHVPKQPPRTGSPDPHVHWNELTEDLRESLRRQSDQIGPRLVAVGCTLEPLTDWDADFFRFEPDEVETLAKMEHDFHRNERLSGRWTYFPGYEDLPSDRFLSPVNWGRRDEPTKEIYREIVRKLPKFLAKVDFQVYRL